MAKLVFASIDNTAKAGEPVTFEDAKLPGGKLELTLKAPALDEVLAIQDLEDFLNRKYIKGGFKDEFGKWQAKPFPMTEVGDRKPTPSESLFYFAARAEIMTGGAIDHEDMFQLIVAIPMVYAGICQKIQEVISDPKDAEETSAAL